MTVTLCRNVRIGLEVEWGDFCLARETPPCNTLRIKFKFLRWRIVKAVVVIAALVNCGRIHLSIADSYL